MSYCMLILYLASVAISSYAGFRLGRDGSTGRGSRQSDSAASTGLGQSLATTEDINSAVDRAIEGNAKASEVIQKMRNIVSRNRGGGDGDSDI